MLRISERIFSDRLTTVLIEMTHIFCCISVGLAVDINLSIYFYNAEKSNHSKQLPSFGINHNQDF